MYLKSTTLILLVSLRLVLCAPPRTFGHSDCNQHAVAHNLLRLCSEYAGFQDKILKREIAERVAGNLPVSKGYGKEAFYQYLQQAMETQSLREYPYPWQIPHRNNRPLPPQTSSPYPWQLSSQDSASPQQQQPGSPYSPDFQLSLNGDAEDLLQPKNDVLDPVNYVEPQDFDTFNYWYLNPVFRESDFKGRNKRWKRTFADEFNELFRGLPRQILDELGNFIKLKCCGRGCPFPHEYAKLDERINFCGMY